MTTFFLRLFVPDYQNTSDPRVRTRYGTLAGIMGIVLNLLLFACKFITAKAIASLAVEGDALNNLTDAGSSVIALITVLISAKPADRDHPFGHARIEYVSSMIVSFLILIVGYDLAKESIGKIIHPAESAYSDQQLIPVLAVLALAVLCKLFMFFFDRKLGRMIDSDVLRATALDSVTDAIATSVVLASALITRFTGVETDAYMGLLVALFILWTGIKVLNETKNSILGEGNAEETTTILMPILNTFPQILGIHDLMVHSYGAGHTVVSLHAEVDGRENIFDIHDTIDNAERTIYDETGITCTIHMDPIVVGDPETDRLHEETEKAVKAVHPEIRIHDFRCVIGTTHTNLIFDMDVPFEIKESPEELIRQTQKTIHEKMGERYYAVITVDRH